MRTARLWIVLGVVIVAATACTLRQNAEYKALLKPDGVHVVIGPKMTTVISDVVYRDVCRTNVVCLGNFLHDPKNVNLSGWGAAEWYTATLYYNDLGNKVWWTYNHRNLCLGLHKDLFAGLNWETNGHQTDCGQPTAGSGSGGGGGGSW